MSEEPVWPPNPFSWGSLPKPEWFAGRANELGVLASSLRGTTEAFAVRGPRGIGKTALVRKFLHDHQAEARGLYLDVRDLVPVGNLGRAEAALQHIVTGIADELLFLELLPRVVRVDQVNERVLLRDALTEICQVGQPRLVIVLDEFDLLPPATIQRVWRFFARARELPCAPLFIAIAGEDWAGASANLLHDAEGNRSRTIRLKPLALDETGEVCLHFARQVGFEFLAEARAAIFSETCGYPLFIAALLSSIYERRWELRERLPVTEDEVQAAARRCEVDMPERVRHAMLQAGPVATRLLHSLAKDNGRTVEDLVQQVAHDWQTSAAEVRATIGGLCAAWIVTKHHGVVRIESPLLTGWVREMPSQEAEQVDHPPHPDAYAGFQIAEAYANEGRRDEAIARLRVAAELDPIFWRARWLLARLRLERAAVSSEAQPDDLTEAIELLAALRHEVPHSSGALQQVDELHRRALMQRALSLPSGTRERGEVLEALRVLDPTFATPGATELWAEEDVHEWSRHLNQSAPERWEQATKDALRKNRCWLLLAESYTERLRIAVATEQTRLTVDLLRWVMPPLLRLRMAAEQYEPLWGAGIEAVRLTAQMAAGESAPLLSAPFWEVLLLSAPQEAGARLAREAFPLIRLALRRAVIDGDGFSAERLVRTLAEVGDQKGLRATFDEVEEIVLLSVHDPNPQKFAASLGRYLAAIWTAIRRHGAGAAAVEAKAVRELATYFCQARADMLAGRKIEVPEAAVTTLNELIRDWQEPAWTSQGPEWLAAAAQVTRFVSLLKPFVPTSSGPAEMSEDDRQWAEHQLGDQYEVLERLPVGISGLSTQVTEETLFAYKVKPRTSRDTGRLFRARVFRLRASTPEVKRLLHHVFDIEHRALAMISPRADGRGLTGLRDAWFRSQEETAVMVTEWHGDAQGLRTLRDLISGPRTGLLATTERWRLWGHLRVLIEAICALHQAGFIHRNLRPEAVFVANEDSAVPNEKPALKLGQFEWSVYLRGLVGLVSPVARELDRYVAPEVLRGSLGIRKPERGPSGESFASDLYGLGLLLFECIVRPLSTQELGFYRTPDSYDAAEQNAHAEWLRRLSNEVADLCPPLESRVNKRPDPRWLSTNERDVLQSLLKFDLQDRPNHLDRLIAKLRPLALRDPLRIFVHGSVQPLRLFTPLRPREDRYKEQPLQDPQCVAYFLARWLPQVAVATNKELTVDVLRRILLSEFPKGYPIQVFINRDPNAFPLLLRSRSGVYFRIQPFKWGPNRGEKVVRPYFAMLEVARREDRPAGDPIAQIEDGLAVFDTLPSEVNPQLNGYQKDRDATWEELFKVAERAADASKESEERIERRRLVQMLRQTLESEREALTEEIEYVVTRDMDQDSQLQGRWIMSAVDKERNLAEIVQHWVTDDSRFEVALVGVPAGRGKMIVLDTESIDTATGNVYLQAELEPSRGVIRPAAGRHAAALYQRRRSVFAQIEEDPELLDTIINPAATSRPRELPREPSLFLAELDQDKQRITRKYLEVSPLIVVQGPPGTGKTTLATELILQELSRFQSGRVLITTQSHEPLDNMLERIEAERRSNAQAREILDHIEIVRIPSGWHKQSREKIRRFYPHVRAEEIFKRMRRRLDREAAAPSLGLSGDVARALEYQLAHFPSAPDSLRRRIRQAANIVFATTNSRDIEAERPSSYDLVVVEEAARSLPIEVIGAMRLARRWLLIGDHRQLPPYGLDAIEKVYRDKLDERRQELRETFELDEHQLTRAKQGVDWLDEDFGRYKKLFERLHEQLGPHRETLRTQWRMHPVIGEMISNVFYDGKAVCNPERREDFDALAARRNHYFTEPTWLKNKQLVWINFDSALFYEECAEQRSNAGRLANQAERRTIVAALRSFRAPRQSSDIAILSPYREQVEQLQGLLHPDINTFNAFGSLADRVFTVDAFQGRQAGTVVLSLVRNNLIRDEPNPGVGFLQSKERATVMFSRAERLLIILGCAAQFERFPQTRWLSEIRERSHCVDWSELVSPDERVKIESVRKRQRRGDDA